MAASFARWMARWSWVAALVVACAGAGCTSSGKTCPTGQLACSGACIDPATDPLHCGACNTACYSGSSCVAGQCECPTATPDTCGIRCVNLQNDPANCGTCGHGCGLGQCTGASCVCDVSPVLPNTITFCPPGATATGTCVDTATNGANCGACGNVCVPNNVCSSSTCQCLSPNTACPGAVAGSTICTNTSTDPTNCGLCGNVCSADQICSGGACSLACSSGLTLCNGNCVNLQNDAANCGVCGRTCSSGQTCSAGTCQAACPTLTCGGTCCGDNTPCCTGNTCPNRHQNFIATSSPQTYFNCTPTGTYDIPSATTAALKWAPNANVINTTLSCPTVGGGTLCVVVQKPLLGSDVGCGVWCYQGPFIGTLTTTQDYTCPCPTTQGTDWN
jgi:Stigma-specific protein, Stig1